VPLLKCIVEDCGSLDGPLPDASPVDGDADPDYPEDAATPLTDEEKLAVAERVRLLGNKQFMAEAYEQAVHKYEKALRYLSAVVPTSANAPTIDEKKVVCFSNSAQCFLKLKQWSEAYTAANNAVNLDAKNTKALFRRGQGSAGMGNFDTAEADFRRCLEMEPGNEGVQQHLQHAVEQQRAQKEKLARNLRKMFA
jgi:tetratricopeptide (TPR) repeat protein